MISSRALGTCTAGLAMLAADAGCEGEIRLRQKSDGTPFVTDGGNYIFDDTPDKLVTWNRTVAFRNPATGHRQIGLRCAADA